MDDLRSKLQEEPLPRRALPATVEAAAEHTPAALERAKTRNLHRTELERLESNEPECTCRHTGADLFDPAGCEAHDPNSYWNVRLRAVTAMEMYEQYEPAGTEPVKYPF